MRSPALLAALLGASILTGCQGEKTAEAPPPPRELTASAIGHFCGMTVQEHAGPKAQILLRSRPEPVWFTSARDAFSFTMLPEEPKDVRAIYVSDMARAPSWEEPGNANWIDAKAAFFVIGSRARGGMGAEETVPFSDRAAAEKFAAENGGWVVAFADVPREYVLGSAESSAAPVPHAQHGAGGTHVPQTQAAPADGATTPQHAH
jgi:copper chaperone NosL